MENIYEYQVIMHESCPCCYHHTRSTYGGFGSFAEARDYISGMEDAELITNDPIAKYYADDERIKYEGE